VHSFFISSIRGGTFLVGLFFLAAGAQYAAINRLY